MTDEETTENSSTDTNRPKTRSNHLNFGTVENHKSRK